MACETRNIPCESTGSPPEAGACACTASWIDFLHQIFEPIFVWKLGGTIILWNESARSLYGFEASEAVGRVSHELLHTEFPPDRAAIEAELGQFGRWEGELRHRARDGRLLTVDTRMSLVRLPDGCGLVIQSHRDVTESREAEERFRVNEQMLRHSQRLAHVGSWEFEVNHASHPLDGRLRWSDECFRIFGYEPGGVDISVGMFFDAVHPDDRGPVMAALDRALRECGPYSIEHRIIRPDASEMVVLEWSEVIADADTGLIRMYGACQDITEKKRAEVARERYASRLESLRSLDRAILSASSPYEIAQAALGHLAARVGYTTAGVAAYDFDGDDVDIEVLAAEGILEDWWPARTRRRDPIAIRPEIVELQNGHAVLSPRIDDTAGSRADGTVLQRLRAAGMRSYAMKPLLDRNLLVGALLLAWDRPTAFLPEYMEAARDVADHVAIAVRQSRLFEEVAAARARLAELSRRLIRAQEDEQRRVARELHDEIGQTLTALKFHLQVIGMKPGDAPSVATRLKESLTLVERTLSQVRSISLDLRPLLLDDLGLAAALASVLDRQARSAGFEARLEVIADDRDFRLGFEVETACFRVAQEALTNVTRHARTRRVEVELRLDDDGLWLVVRDDGAGFDPVESQAGGRTRTSLGLVGMQERAALVGGRLTIRSAPGRGTEVSAWFPVAPTDPAG